MSRSSEAEDVRIAKAVSVLREEIARSKDLDAEGDEGEFPRVGRKGIGGGRGDLEGKFCLESLERSPRGGDHGCSVISRGITKG